MTSKISVDRVNSANGQIVVQDTSSLDLSNTSTYFAVPSGPESSEGSPSSQALRYNTDTGYLNIHNGTEWTNVIDVSDPLASTKTTLIRDGLILYLDASNPASYPGTGTDWFDVSGNDNHYEITGGSPTTWNAGGWFDVDFGSTAFLGPPSSDMGFVAGDNEHTIISVGYWSSPSNSQFFWWVANTGGNNRAIASHLPWSNSYVYYDVAGCCNANQRINAESSTFRNNVSMITFRNRVTAKPERQIFKNTTEFLNSGTNSTSKVIAWSDQGRSILCNNWQGRIYALLAYNKALTDTELLQNYNSLKGKFGF